jgi:hypothetical protein
MHVLDEYEIQVLQELQVKISKELAIQRALEDLF